MNRRSDNRQHKMSGFGAWYEEQKQQQAQSIIPDEDSSGGVGGILGKISLAPLFGGGEGSTDDGDVESGSIPGMFDGISLGSAMEATTPTTVFGMGYQQRFRAFVALLLTSVTFFALGFGVGLPLIAVRPQKFALCFTCGSLTFMFSFAILRGPSVHLAAMMRPERRIFSAIYLFSMFATLFATLRVGGVKGYFAVLMFSGIQLLALMWYLLSSLPGGSAGIGMVTKVAAGIIRPLVSGCVSAARTCFGTIFG